MKRSWLFGIGILCLLLGGLLVGFTTTLAQWTNDPYNGMVNVCNALGTQDVVRVCALGSGNSLMAWHDNRTSVTQTFCQALNAYGTPHLGNNGQPLFVGSWSYGWGGPSIPGVISDGQGGSIAVVMDNRDGSWDIYGQRFDSLGNRLWGDTGLPLVVWPGQQDVLPKDVAADSLGDFFIAWDVYVEYGNTDTYVQKFNVAGQRLWGEYGISASNLPGNQGAPQIVPNGIGGVMDVWEAGPEPNHFYFQHFDVSGNPLLAVNGVPVHDMSGQLMATSLLEGVTDGEGGGVWCNWGVGGPNNCLYLFRLNGDGRTQWVWSNYSYCQHAFNDLLYHPYDGTIWLDVTENPGGVWSNNLYRFDHDGNPLIGNNGVPYGGYSLSPTSDGVITVEVYYDTQSTHMQALRINNQGQQIWSSNVALGPADPGGGPIFAYPSTMVDGSDGIVVAFNDNRNQTTDPDLSAQRVLSNGQLGNPVPNPKRPDPTYTHLDVTGNLLTYTLPQAGEVRLDLYDLLGRKVATLLEGNHPAGKFTTPLNIIGLPSGLYFLHLSTSADQQTAKVLVTK